MLTADAFSPPNYPLALPGRYLSLRYSNFDFGDTSVRTMLTVDASSPSGHLLGEASLAMLVVAREGASGVTSENCSPPWQAFVDLGNLIGTTSADLEKSYPSANLAVAR